MQRIFSIGHSTRSLDELLELLGAHGVVQEADVRAVPASQRHPQFTRAHLEVALPAAGVAYRWLPGLGGQRQPGPAPSPNTAWRDAAFRAYADHMATAAFAAARQELEAWARARPTACMCAEAD